MAELIRCALGIALVVLAVISVSREAQAFTERFPPITDDEFLALCKPGTDPRIALRVRRIVADHLAVEYDRIHPSMSFIEDIGAD